jgi:hypothetical protein
MLRRLKKDVARQLPVKRRQVVRLPRPHNEDWPPTLGSKRLYNGNLVKTCHLWRHLSREAAMPCSCQQAVASQKPQGRQRSTAMALHIYVGF